jgi:hypothetical protein
VAGSVSAALRALLTSERRETTPTAPGSGGPPDVHPFYAHALHAKPMPRLDEFAQSTVLASSPAWFRDHSLIRLRQLCAVRRRFFRVSFRSDRVSGLKPGDVVTFTHRRYGLQAGKPLFVVSVPRRPRKTGAPLVLWG